ncbi:TrkH family potassium uptake protein [Gillisia sp. Hel_I_29]|uniref:TrkH family potassium uptake protein n=1 Tax=Gillisia sp. Hel_I_29 TaxID=1249975 RepID=UPI0009DFA871|nr:potassium transporter TrkG [Gillisia sp. Hel_I_29]
MKMLENIQSFQWSPRFTHIIQRISFWLSLISVILVFYDLGFQKSDTTAQRLITIYLSALFVGCISIGLRYIFSGKHPGFKVKVIDIIILTLFVFLIIIRTDLLVADLGFFNKKGWLYLAVFLYFIREFSSLRLDFKTQYFNPAQLFITSFLGIILIGTFLLLLPNATHSGISLIDALFTSTSAVCVTGLIVVDTGSYFTQFGQTIILVLIQLGGIGIMTFATYFSYFFRGQSSYETQLMMRDMTNSEKIGEVFSAMKRILLITFTIEFIGGILIFFSLGKSITGIGTKLFFSTFHTISSFCNAGFSTLANSLYEPGFRFNYPLHIILALLFILGGLGFPIVLNVYTYFKHLIINRVLPLRKNERCLHRPWVINMNTRIVLLSTFVLLIGGSIGFYALEYDNTLAAHTEFGKIVTAFFGAATPRTAGFNSIDYADLRFGTLMLIFLLMWIGASPASTGGGIKTSTFAIATLNFFSLAKGKDRIELYKREIADISVRRAFAIISLSLMVIGIAISLIVSFDPDQNLLKIAFECFSAYSTVGLSMGITSALSDPSKMVLIATMFIGRVSMLTILIAMLRRVRHLNYKYPTEEILIN